MSRSGVRLFISHASEDKDDIARPLALELQRRGHIVWFDEFVLSLGSSLKRSIDRGLAECSFGVVILSENFFAKSWTQEELAGLTSREMGEKKTLIFPVWHKIGAEKVREFSPTLADRLGISSTIGVKGVADNICKSVSERRKADDLVEFYMKSPFGGEIFATFQSNSVTGLSGDKAFSKDEIMKAIEGLTASVDGTTLRKK